jgi:putative transposase
MTTTLDGGGEEEGRRSVSWAASRAELVRLAKEQGLSLTGPDGLLKQLTKTVLETSLNEEMTEHLGYEKHDPAGAGTGNIRNGTRSKTVLTENIGQVEIEVPRDRAGTYAPQIVRKRQRRRRGGALPLCQGPDHRRDQCALRRDLRRLGQQGDHQPDHRQGDRRNAGLAARPLDEIYAAGFIDAIVVKVRDGQVANRPFYAAIGVTLEGQRDILGLWAGTGGEGRSSGWLCSPI